MVVRLRVAYERGKAHAIAVVAEGVRYGAKGAGPLLQEHRHLGFELRATILGRAQRGGMPGVLTGCWVSVSAWPPPSGWPGGNTGTGGSKAGPVHQHPAGRGGKQQETVGLEPLGGGQGAAK